MKSVNQERDLSGFYLRENFYRWRKEKRDYLNDKIVDYKEEKEYLRTHVLKNIKTVEINTPLVCGGYFQQFDQHQNEVRLISSEWPS